MLIHLPIIILTSLHVIPVADAVPKFDILRECRNEGGDTEIQKRCTEDESQARNQLQTEWTQFTSDARRLCMQETNMDGTPSYVEFVTCLEMERDARTEREASKAPK
jgi:NAD-dependent SIR2 family protein deacetylase